jgi:hypothetical protein
MIAIGIGLVIVAVRRNRRTDVAPIAASPNASPV